MAKIWAYEIIAAYRKTFVQDGETIYNDWEETWRGYTEEEAFAKVDKRAEEVAKASNCEVRVTKYNTPKYIEIDLLKTEEE